MSGATARSCVRTSTASQSAQPGGSPAGVKRVSGDICEEIRGVRHLLEDVIRGSVTYTRHPAGGPSSHWTSSTDSNAKGRPSPVSKRDNSAALRASHWLLRRGARLSQALNFSVTSFKKSTEGLRPGRPLGNQIHKVQCLNYFVCFFWVSYDRKGHNSSPDNIWFFWPTVRCFTASRSNPPSLV